MNNSLREKWHGSGKQIVLQKLVSFSVCLYSVPIIEDSCCNGLADNNNNNNNNNNNFI